MNTVNPYPFLDFVYPSIDPSLHRSTQEGNIPLFSAIEVGNLSVSRELLLTHTQVTTEKQ